MCSVCRIAKSQPIEWRQAVHVGILAAKANLIPGLLLITCGILLIISYYQIDVVRDALGWVEKLKDRYGYAFAIASTSFFGGILPLIFRRIFLKQGSPWSVYLFQIVFWAEKGLELDLFYNLQAMIFGQEANWQTVLAKVLVDQLIYSPIIAVPSMVLAYLWKECGFSISRTRAALRERNFWERSLPLLLSNWAVWIPGVFIIYSFPLLLQLPLQNLILTIWVMLLILLTRNKPVQSRT